MKIFLPLIFFILSSAYAGTCTTTTRNNYSTGQVLTSSALNADFNQLVTKVNSFDGGCVTDGTLEASALNSTDFTTVTSGIFQGCSLSYSDSNTVLIGKCIASVNGSLIRTTTATSAAMGCSGCAGDVSNTQYYVYIKAGSSGTTITPLILTTVPNADGYDNSGNKVVGRFLNKPAAADIDQYSIESWSNGGYQTLDGKNITPGINRPIEDFIFSFGTTNSTTACTSSPCFVEQFPGTIAVSSVTRSGTGAYLTTFARPYTAIMCDGVVNGTSVSAMLPQGLITGSTFAIISKTAEDVYGTIHCKGY